MNNNSYVKIFASRVAPDPAMDVMWMDLAEDPKGSIIKFWNGDSYVPISTGNSGDLENVLADITSEIDQIKNDIRTLENAPNSAFVVLSEEAYNTLVLDGLIESNVVYMIYEV